MSRLRVNESSERNFIKMILTKNQERSKKDKKDKKWIRIRKSRCVELDRTFCYIEKFNTALSLCRVLEVALYYSKGFSEAATRDSAVAEAL